jgi:hypothetical protein
LGRRYLNWNPGWAWLILTLFIVLFVVIFDVHAYYAHTEMMTGRFRDWLFNPVTGPFMFGGWIGIFAGLTFHWFEKKL